MSSFKTASRRPDNQYSQRLSILSSTVVFKYKGSCLADGEKGLASDPFAISLALKDGAEEQLVLLPRNNHR